MQRPWTTGLGRAAIAVIGVFAGLTSSAMGQVPSRIPSDPEAQIFDLIKRVTALEEQLAALKGGKATLRLKAPAAWSLKRSVAGIPKRRIPSRSLGRCSRDAAHG